MNLNRRSFMRMLWLGAVAAAVPVAGLGLVGKQHGGLDLTSLPKYKGPFEVYGEFYGKINGRVYKCTKMTFEAYREA